MDESKEDRRILAPTPPGTIRVYAVATAVVEIVWITEKGVILKVSAHGLEP